MKNKRGYSNFAHFYDGLMEADYEEISDRIDHIVMSEMGKRGILLDLGCGTGTLCEIMAKKGYDVVGVDASEEMLSVAMEKRCESGLPIQYLKQDMQNIDMFGTIDVIVCTLDSINHLETFEDVEKTFERVSLFAQPGGLFIFDMNTIYKHKNILGNNTFVYENEDVYCVWQNFLEENNRVDICLDIFEREEDESYIRHSEEFSEIVFSMQQGKAMLEKSGFEVVGIYDGYTEKSPCETTERLVFCCKKPELQDVIN